MRKLTRQNVFWKKKDQIREEEEKRCQENMDEGNKA